MSLVLLLIACSAILGFGIFVALGRTRLPVLSITFRDVESSQVWSRLAQQTPSLVLVPTIDIASRLRTIREVSRYHRLNPPHVFVCIGAPEEDIPDKQVNVWPSETESGPLLYVVSGCRTTVLVFACISSGLKATAVYVSMPDHDFGAPVFHFVRFLMGIPTESVYDLEWLLRRNTSEQTPTRVYFWRAAGKRTKHFPGLSTGTQP